ncbi:type II secretion system F family protein [Breoghania sp. L-A4]|uniref:type II secretion system F family protein n=1 Tax=Breoghania sp. L-A4 TaxID=2304600 RepID=UPI000E35B103|nr:type II secretion system F family protein [Breoghania sp. L-A4]AXS39090.1 type II secretion system F family protein [Breoghania sp. L-A4]
MDGLMDLLLDEQVLIAVFTVLAVSATVFTLVMPAFERDTLQRRMKSVATERQEMRARQRARMQIAEKPRVSLRNQPKQNLRSVVDRLNLKNALADESTMAKLRVAGLRGQQALYMYLFARLVVPIILFGAALMYFFVLVNTEHPTGIKLSASLVVAMIGFYLPNLYVKNRTQNRQHSIRLAWPDALDLMLICVESGMSVEAALKKVAEEIGAQSVPLAEELALTNAELSYLQERRTAYENLAGRTGLEGVKSVTTALIQAERYGTPLGSSLRVMADENRDQRMQAAEQKAAALPPKLTVPMIIFFLPVLFGVIMGPRSSRRCGCSLTRGARLRGVTRDTKKAPLRTATAPFLSFARSLSLSFASSRRPWPGCPARCCAGSACA